MDFLKSIEENNAHIIIKIYKVSLSTFIWVQKSLIPNKNKKRKFVFYKPIIHNLKF